MRFRLAVIIGMLAIGLLLFGAAFVQPGARANEPRHAAIDLPVGQNVEIWLRGDASGVSQQGTATIDRLVRQSGTIVRVTDRWLVISNGGSEYWIPRDMILIVKTK